MEAVALAMSDARPAARAARFKRVCPECGTPHTAIRRDAEFCGDACRKVFNNRRAVRGAELYDLFMVIRCERGVAQALGVWKLLCRLAQGYREDDVREREGRPSWRPAKRVLERHAYLYADRLQSRTWKKPNVQ
jgi:predicted nucleic acid-binding Zn ribbon protein